MQPSIPGRYLIVLYLLTRSRHGDPVFVAAKGAIYLNGNHILFAATVSVKD